GIENAMRILEPQDLVVLHEIDRVGLQTPQRLVDLSGRLFPRSAVDLRHYERTAPVAVAKRLAHTPLARAVVVVPAVVQERDAAVDGGANDSNREFFGDVLQTEMPAADADARNHLTRAAQRAQRDVRRHARADWQSRENLRRADPCPSNSRNEGHGSARRRFSRDCQSARA